MQQIAGSPMVMGILNVTPDSFSDGGLHLDPEVAVSAAVRMAGEGAAIIDVGGESTRPGAIPVQPSEEQRRVLPVLEALAADPALAGVRLSVDTRNESTARAAVGLGATLINDVSAQLWRVAADTGAGWVAMHMAGDPATMQTRTDYVDVVSDVRRFLEMAATEAERAGVREVWVDPGIGFGKTTAQNISLLANLGRLVGDGRPVLVGSSRKRSIGTLIARSDGGQDAHPGPCGGAAPFDTVDPSGTDDRLEGSLATGLWAIIQGARSVRVHEIRATAQAVAALAGRPASG